MIHIQSLHNKRAFPASTLKEALNVVHYKHLAICASLLNKVCLSLL